MKNAKLLLAIVVILTTLLAACGSTPEPETIVQPVVKDLEDTFALKEQSGDRICFHGGIDVQQVLPNASVDEVRYEVARRLYDLGRGGGYILAPCHNINVDIPVENIVALFEAAQAFGHYPLEREADV